jgi:hypothetical protein
MGRPRTKDIPQTPEAFGRVGKTEMSVNLSLKAKDLSNNIVGMLLGIDRLSDASV